MKSNRKKRQNSPPNTHQFEMNVVSLESAHELHFNSDDLIECFGPFYCLFIVIVCDENRCWVCCFVFVLFVRTDEMARFGRCNDWMIVSCVLLLGCVCYFFFSAQFRYRNSNNWNIGEFCCICEFVVRFVRKHSKQMFVRETLNLVCCVEMTEKCLTIN